MPFSAVELKEAEENSIDLQDDISMSIEQHTIVAFIRSYESTFHGQSQLKMNVVKAYKLGEVLPQLNITAGSSAINLQAKEHISEFLLDVATPAMAKGKEQLFTPSIKLILEEISSQLVSKAVKKPLTFSDDHLLNETTSRINRPHGTHVSTNNESPIKAAASTLAAKKKELEPRVTDPIPALATIKKEMGARLNTHPIPTRASIRKEVGSQVMDENPTKKTKNI